MCVCVGVRVRRCVCVRACVRECVRVVVCVWREVGGGLVIVQTFSIKQHERLT